jgi:hypothetical protein
MKNSVMPALLAETKAPALFLNRLQVVGFTPDQIVETRIALGPHRKNRHELGGARGVRRLNQLGESELFKDCGNLGFGEWLRNE